MDDFAGNKALRPEKGPSPLNSFMNSEILSWIFSQTKEPFALKIKSQ